MRKRDVILDSLKGISIIGIVLVHTESNKLPVLASQIQAMGASFTILFLLISVFLMVESYNINVVNGEMSFSKWFTIKIVRIIPMYYMCIFLRIIMGKSFFLYASTDSINIFNLFSHLILLNGFIPQYANSLLGIEWFVSVLAFFYLITPVMNKLINGISKACMCFLITSTLALLLNHFCVVYCFNNIESISYYNYVSWIGGWLPIVYLEVYSAGMVLYQAIKKRNIFSEMVEHNRKILSITLLGLFFIFFAACIVDEFRIYGISSRAILVSTYSTLILSLYASSNRIIVNPIFALIGRYTWGIYLFHTIIITLVKMIPIGITNTVMNWICRSVICLCLSFALSVMLTNFFERPLLFMIDKRILNYFRI